jgi:hypothetical protein
VLQVSLRDGSTLILLDQLEHLCIGQLSKREFLSIARLEGVGSLVARALLLCLFACTSYVFTSVAPPRAEAIAGTSVRTVGETPEANTCGGFDGFRVSAVATFMAAGFDVPFAGNAVEAYGGETAGGHTTADLISLLVLEIITKDASWWLRWGSSRCRLLLRHCPGKLC